MNSTNFEFDSLTKGLVTKSDKIRKLGRAGAKPGDIARYLGIRYQHARNVLVDAGLHSGRTAEGFSEESSQLPVAQADETTRVSSWLTVGSSGELTVPAALLAGLGLAPGSRAYVGPSGCGLEVLSREGAMRRLDEIAAKYRVPGESVVDELIAERRKEAAKEDAQ